jgi:hypothetical protein
MRTLSWSRRLEHDLRFDPAQALAPRQDIGLGRRDRGGRAAAVPDRLAEREADEGRVGLADTAAHGVGNAIAVGVDQAAAGGVRGAGLQVAGLGGEAERRAEARARLHIGLVQRPLHRPLRQQIRVGVIGQRNGVGERLGARRRGEGAGQSGRENRGEQASAKGLRHSLSPTIGERDLVSLG